MTSARAPTNEILSRMSKFSFKCLLGSQLWNEHVLCYLCGTWIQTIRYSRDSHENPNVLWVWVVADWAGNPDTRRSHTGYILMMNGGAIFWKSLRQDNVSLSTFEAGFFAASQAHQEAIYLREALLVQLILDISKLKQFFSMKTILPVLVWVRILCAGNSLVTSTSNNTLCANSS